MKKLTSVVIIILVFIGANYTLGQSPPIKRGYIKNSNNDKCWYKTNVDTSASYFGGDTEYIIVFENPSCMINDDVSKMLIANILVRYYCREWYQPDANFKTNPREWKRASGLQKRGYCIKSKKYPNIALIWLDLVLSKDGKYIQKVIHAAGY